MNGIDLHLVTKENTFENHAMPNEKIIATLMKNSNVEYTILIFYRKALIDTRRLQVPNHYMHNLVGCENLAPTGHL